MTQTKKYIVGIGIIVFLGFLGRFVYFNITVPWPHRHELKACLKNARMLATESEVEHEENICFRTYPHFL